MYTFLPLVLPCMNKHLHWKKHFTFFRNEFGWLSSVKPPQDSFKFHMTKNVN